MSTVSPGTYSQVMLTISNPQITVLNQPTPILTSFTGQATSFAVTLDINPPLVVTGNTSVALNLDFNLRKSIQTNATGQVTGTLTVLLGAIAAISLVVGGIGIMNIMLVTVTERTREIGIRKAIGARRSDILLQFLIESMVLSGLGGVLGIATGWLISTQITSVKLGAIASLPPPIVSIPSVVLAFGVSVGIGLFFGIYPANRAARLHPIQALRYE